MNSIEELEMNHNVFGDDPLANNMKLIVVDDEPKDRMTLTHRVLLAWTPLLKKARQEGRIKDFDFGFYDVPTICSHEGGSRFIYRLIEDQEIDNPYVVVPILRNADYLENIAQILFDTKARGILELSPSGYHAQHNPQKISCLTRIMDYQHPGATLKNG